MDKQIFACADLEEYTVNDWDAFCAEVEYITRELGLPPLSPSQLDILAVECVLYLKALISAAIETRANNPQSFISCEDLLRVVTPAQAQRLRQLWAFYDEFRRRTQLFERWN